MIDAMPRKLPAFVYRETSRHGRGTVYFRRGKGKRTRLPNDITSDEFKVKYEKALTGKEPEKIETVSPKSLRWLVTRYMESAKWQELSASSRKQRSLIFLDAIKKANNPPFAAVTQEKIQNAMARKAATPAQANNFLKAFRGLFIWAVKNHHVKTNPTNEVERLKYKSDGFPAWTVEDLIIFRQRHREGTKARLAMELLLITGLRRSDIVQAGFQHIRNGIFSMTTQKTGAVISVEIPVYISDLMQITPTGDLHFLVSDINTPFTVESFGNWFRARCREAGIAKSAHGLRKLSATLAAEGGAKSHQIMAQYGWSNIAQAETYTRKADRARLGVSASKIVAEQIESTFRPHLESGAGKTPKKPTKTIGEK